MDYENTSQLDMNFLDVLLQLRYNINCYPLSNDLIRIFIEPTQV